MLLLLAAMGASARSERMPEERQQRGSPPPSQYDARRGGAPDEQWQNRGRNGEPNEGPARPRMSPDERRELRQQIDRAGRDIYPPRR
ncbi:hypothetical protein CAter282_2619 [Collimonas arenae]|uniref:Uncharacterized protein n=1 Tax=Collimonas arenae TaxID=279058 RepID=A0A127QL93_9BURK|nr:hypothetical protein CAter282_2619 [Collimonas arenae]